MTKKYPTLKSVELLNSQRTSCAFQIIRNIFSTFQSFARTAIASLRHLVDTARKRRHNRVQLGGVSRNRR